MSMFYLHVVFVAEQAGLSRNWSEIPKKDFLASRPISYMYHVYQIIYKYMGGIELNAFFLQNLRIETKNSLF